MRVIGLTNLIVDFYLYDNKILLNGGGTVANVLANLSSMGINTSVYGFYGNDLLGKFAKDQLSEVRVDTSLLEMKDYKTKCFFIDKNGTTSTCPFCGKKRKNYRTRNCIETILKKDDIVLVQDLHNLGNIKNRIIWDFGYAKGLIFMDNREIENLVFRKYFIVNLKKQVLDLLLRKMNLTFSEFIAKIDIDFLIITDGKKGSTILHEGIEHKFTPKIFKETETNGCGDMYLATFISEILNEEVPFDFKKINEKAQNNVQEVLKKIGARDYVSPNIEIDFNGCCICDNFKLKNT